MRRWTCLQILTAVVSVGAQSATEVLSLLYRETNGKNWKMNDGWLVGDACDGTWMTRSKYDCYSGELTNTYQPICCELVSLTDTEPRVSGTRQLQATEAPGSGERTSCLPAWSESQRRGAS